MWVKICGIRDTATARAVSALRPDAIGLNFYSRSPRRVSPEIAREIVSALPAGVEPVGLFVNQPVAEVLATCRACGLKTVQLHGDEPPDVAAELARGGLNVIHAYRLGTGGLAPLEEYLAECGECGVRLFGMLIDACVEGQYGGTGATARWELLGDGQWRPDWPPLILAGGLRPQNVAAAVAAVRPWGVDVASGVESSPGEKDVQAIAEFIAAARATSAAGPAAE